MLPKTLPKLVLIEWIDHGSHGDGGWTSIEAVRDGVDNWHQPCWACGFVLSESDRSITVANQLTCSDPDDDDAACSGDITIHKALIVSIKELN